MTIAHPGISTTRGSDKPEFDLAVKDTIGRLFWQFLQDVTAESLLLPDGSIQLLLLYTDPPPTIGRIEGLVV